MTETLASQLSDHLQHDHPAGRVGQEPAVWEWAIIEIFGHRRHVGRAREEERFGAKMLRIDVPIIRSDMGDRPNMAPLDGALSEIVDRWETHWYGGSSIFSYTLTDEATVIKANTPRPHEAPRPYLPRPATYEGHDGYGDGE